MSVSESEERARSHRVFGADIPMQPTPLIGREREIEEACALLCSGEACLLTLTGPGGVGKTRLGLRVAAELEGEFVDGARFVSLASIREPDLVIPVIARTLGLGGAGEGPLSERLAERLRERELLLLLDNLEQVVEAAPRVAELLAACPRLEVLATSREVLRLSCERVFPVPPLGLPDPERPPRDVRTLSGYEAVAYFVERARAVKPDFRLTGENAPAVTEICARLDGLPLGIQLAAARVKLLSPEAVLERLRSRLRLLKGGARDAPARQRTLKKAIGWSYDLLEAGERLLFGRLSVFAGGCTLEAAEAVCDTEELAEEALDVLASLMDKSLLYRTEAEDGEVRFRMLETIREYALERLEADGGGEEIRCAHATHYLALAEEAEPELNGPQQLSWFERLDAEHGNLRAALGWSLERGEAELALRLGSALGPFWANRGHHSEGTRWLEVVISAGGDAAPGLRAKALGALGLVLENYGDLGRLEAPLEESLALYRELGAGHGTASVLRGLGYVELNKGDFERSEALLEESLALSREFGDGFVADAALTGLAVIALERGDLERSEAFMEESLASSRRRGDTKVIAYSLHNWGYSLASRGEYERTAAMAEEAVALFRGLDNRRGVALSLVTLGIAALGRGDPEAAKRLAGESLTLNQEVGDRCVTAENLEILTGVAGSAGEAARAARLWGAAEALREAVGVPVPPFVRALHEGYVAAVRSQLGEALWEEARVEGRAMTMAQAVTYALEGIQAQPSQADAGERAAVDPEPAETPARLAGLTAGEVEVLRLVASGMTNARVAEKLFVSRRTVDAHLRSVYRKLGVGSRTAATRQAIDHGLL